MITDEAVSWLKNREQENPFFLYLAYNAPHFGKGYSPKDKKPVNIMQAQAADLKRVSSIEDKIRREFAAMTVNLDDGVGRVIATLDETGLAEDTLLIFLTDHGGEPVYGGSNIPLRGNKAQLFEGGIKVPCLMRWPGKIKPGRTITEPCSALDLFPTFADIAGIEEAAPHQDGTSLAAVLEAQKAPQGDREFFWQTGKHAELDRNGWGALRRSSYKYVSSPKQGEFLFDISNDPNEKSNLKSKEPEKFSALKDRWQELEKIYHTTSPTE